jgi:trehalose-phosphatase
VALLLDFDGTLVNLRARPGEVRFGEPARRVLSRLVRHPRVVVVIVSGRALADIRRRVGIRGVRYFGLFGWEHDGATVAANLRARRRIEKAKTAVRATIRDFPGVWMEDKGLSFVIHFRSARRAVIQRARSAVRRILRRFRPGLRILSGKKTWEILPSMIRGKGAAVSALLARLPQSTLAIYAGDDVADESAFRALRRGITVRVGKSRHTRARFRLHNPREVLQFLRKLEGQLPCARPSHFIS